MRPGFTHDHLQILPVHGLHLIQARFLSKILEILIIIVEGFARIATVELTDLIFQGPGRAAFTAGQAAVEIVGSQVGITFGYQGHIGTGDTVGNVQLRGQSMAEQTFDNCMTETSAHHLPSLTL